MAADLPDEDRLARLLAEFDDARRQGQTPVTQEWLTPAERERLEKDQRVLQQLDQVWPRVRTEATHFGRFEIRRELGRGGFGIVFLAFDPLLKREVALKMPRAEALLTPDLQDRFMREARAAAALDHPNIVPVFESGKVGAVSYIVSAYCPGSTLAAWLAQLADPLSPCAAALLIAELAEAVQHAHTHGILHRDLKPANILLVFAREPVEKAANPPSSESQLNTAIARITDFGLARILDIQQDQTRSSTLLGSPPYMAPEQAEARHSDLGPATDVYALGAILYELLTRRPPFLEATALLTLEQVRRSEPIPPRRLRCTVPRDLETICLKCLRKDSAERYASADALADDLHRFLDERPIQARPVSVAQRVRLWCRRPERMRDAGFLAIMVAIVFAVWCFMCYFTGLVPFGGSTAVYVASCIAVCYSPMIWLGWMTIRGHVFAAWINLVISLFFAAWCQFGRQAFPDVPVPGDLYTLQFINLFFAVLGCTVSVSQGIAIYSHSVNRRSSPVGPRKTT